MKINFVFERCNLLNVNPLTCFYIHKSFEIREKELEAEDWYIRRMRVQTIGPYLGRSESDTYHWRKWYKGAAKNLLFLHLLVEINV